MHRAVPAQHAHNMPTVTGPLPDRGWCPPASPSPRTRVPATRPAAPCGRAAGRHGAVPAAAVTPGRTTGGSARDTVESGPHGTADGRPHGTAARTGRAPGGTPC